jgi:hypothetical protein
VGLITLPPSCADLLKMWEPQPTGNPQGKSNPVLKMLSHLPMKCNFPTILIKNNELSFMQVIYRLGCAERTASIHQKFFPKQKIELKILKFGTFDI